MRKKLEKIKIEMLEFLLYNGEKTIERLRKVSFKKTRSRTIVQKHIDEMIMNGMIKTIRFPRRGSFAYDTIHYGLTIKGRKIAGNLPNIMNQMKEKEYVIDDGHWDKSKFSFGKGTSYVDNWIQIIKKKK